MIDKNFNEGWLFWEDNSSFELLWGIPENAEKVDLPHDAMIHQDANPESANGGYSGYLDGHNYIYVKRCIFGDELKDHAVMMRFEGIYMNAFVYLNGQLVGKNPNGYTSFSVRLDPMLRPGEENEIRVMVRNGATPNSRWYSGGGIYRNVHLLIGDHTRISEDGVRITTIQCDDELAMIEVRTRLENETNYRKQVMLRTALSDDNGEISAAEDTRILLDARSSEEFVQRIMVPGAKLWSEDSPYLYNAELRLSECDSDGKPAGEIDSAEERFGIRRMELDPVRGLRINGAAVKLRGACIHHDSGIIGAATYEALEYRRIRKLKEAGFNAVRMSHHPMADCTLRACDELGMYVMNEFSDVWTRMKTGFDYGMAFDEWWERDIEALVRSSYNHPSVILYSIGNEIPDMGTDKGVKLTDSISNKIRSLDSGRYVTAGINGVYAAGERVRTILQEIMADEASEIDLQGNVNEVMTALGKHEDEVIRHDILSRKLEMLSAGLDIAGYNYMTGRYASDAERYPNRIMVGTETFPTQIAENWELVREFPQLIGDFTWTGWDYRGESAVGIKFYAGDNRIPGMQFPYQLAYCGDFDLTGIRRPASYFREIVFGRRNSPYIAVQDPEHFDEPVMKTAWTWDDDISSWTWQGYEGRPIKVAVYSADEEVELFINGESKGRMSCGAKSGYRAEFTVTYEPGTVTAFSYDECGNKTSEYTLETAGDYSAITIEEEPLQLGIDKDEFVILNIHLADENGSIVTDQKKKLTAEVTGDAVMLGFGSGDPAPNYSCQCNTAETYYGNAQLILKKTGSNAIHVAIRDDDYRETIWNGGNA